MVSDIENSLLVRKKKKKKKNNLRKIGQTTGTTHSPLLVRR